MALTVEPGTFPAYVVDHLTGKTYQVGAPLPDHDLDSHSDVDLVTTPPIDGQSLVWDSLAVDVDGVAGQWVPNLVMMDTWVFKANATGGVDPGPGNLTIVSDGASPPVWTFEVSAIDKKRLFHNLSVMQARDTIVVTDLPTVGSAVTLFQRLEIIAQPTDRTGWYSFTAKVIELGPSISLPPIVGSELAIDFGFGGGAIKFIDELDNVDTTTVPPVDGHALVWDSAAVDADGNTGQWVPTSTQEVFVEDVEPAGIEVDMIWADTSQMVPLDTLPFLPITGGTMTGNINMSVGSDIVMGSGSIIDYPNEEGDKVLFYGSEGGGSNFGAGITAGTLSLFAGTNGKVSFRNQSSTGTEWGFCNAGGITSNAGNFNTSADNHGYFMNSGGGIYKKSGTGVTIRKHSGNTMIGIENNDGSNRQDIVTVSGGQTLTHTNLTLSSHLVINGSDSTNTSHYYVNAANSNNDWKYNILEGRRADNKRSWIVQGTNGSGVENGLVREGRYILEQAGGDDGNVVHLQMYIQASDGDPKAHFAGYIGCRDMYESSSLAHKSDVEALDPVKASELIDKLEPITFRRSVTSGTDAKPGLVRPGIPRIGFSVENILEAGVHTERLVQGEGADAAFNPTGLLAIAVTEIKSLRARVAELESQTPAPRKKRGA